MKPTSTLGAGCLLLDDDRVLLVMPNYGKAKGRWILPGGFVQQGEPLESACLRELREETGQIGTNPKLFCVRYRLDPSDVYWVFRADLHQKVPVVVQREELIDARFFPIEFALKSPEVRPMTRYFLSCYFSAEPRSLPLPEEFAKNNFVFFAAQELSS